MYDKNKYMKDYTLKNKDKISKQRKERLLIESDEKREHRLDRLSKWREKNRESIREYAKVNYQKDSTKFKTYSKEAIKRGYEFNLSYQEFLDLFHQNCTYCYKEDARGIDRVDNSKGYILENCVSCCEICNRMKWKLDKNDFLKHIESIYNNSIKIIK